MSGLSFGFFGAFGRTQLDTEYVIGEVMEVPLGQDRGIQNKQAETNNTIIIRKSSGNKFRANINGCPYKVAVGSKIGLLYVCGTAKKILVGVAYSNPKTIKEVGTVQFKKPKEITRSLGIEASSNLFNGFLAAFGIGTAIYTEHLGGIVAGAVIGGILYHMTVTPSENRAERELNSFVCEEMEAFVNAFKNTDIR
jgi:hypothetical protein